jgi:bifunctional non-homologous end joining protein LigD
MLINGNLKFILHGTKLQGKWALIRMGGKAAQESKPNWLLIKEHDNFERPASDVAVTEAMPDSVVTGRSLEAIAADEDHVWNSKEADKGSTSKVFNKKVKHGLPPAMQSLIQSAPRESLPEFVQPQLASQATAPPEGKDWLHELKLDGYRIQARVQRQAKSGKVEVSLLTRTGLNWTDRMARVASELSQLDVQSAIFDGEVVVLTATGGTSFADLQAAFQEQKKKPLTYFVFDLMHLDGHNLRLLELKDRKAILREILTNLADGNVVHYCDHLTGIGKTIFSNACQLGAEGIVSKQLSAKYTSGRSSGWLKMKCINEQEFVIAGYTAGSKGNSGIGALLLGYYDNGMLIYAGRTGTGFTQSTHKMLQQKLDSIVVKVCPFQQIPKDAKGGVTSTRPKWVEPKLVAQVRFANWTADNLLRQASYKGLREDKTAKEVTREKALATTKEPGDELTESKTEKKSSKTTYKSEVSAAPIRLTHPDKIIDLETGLTKRALVDYYWAVAGNMLPHLANRPVSIVRCPNGSVKPCFFQKHVVAGLPPGVTGIEIADRKGGPLESYITFSSADTLAGLAQLGVLELHPWGSRSETLETPDRIIFDLDPDESISWRTLADSAVEVRRRLSELGLTSFVKTTGGKGLHVVVPIKPGHDWTVVKEFAHVFANRMAVDNPRLYLIKMTKAARKGKIYIDYLRNERGATAVAPYSPRARAGMCVAIPLDWKELSDNKLPLFHVAEFSNWEGRLARDPWKKMLSTSQSLSGEAVESNRSQPGK